MCNINRSDNQPLHDHTYFTVRLQVWTETQTQLGLRLDHNITRVCSHLFKLQSTMYNVHRHTYSNDHAHNSSHLTLLPLAVVTVVPTRFRVPLPSNPLISAKNAISTPPEELGAAMSRQLRAAVHRVQSLLLGFFNFAGLKELCVSVFIDTQPRPHLT